MFPYAALLSGKFERIPKLPSKITDKDVELLENAIAANLHQKVESNIMRVTSYLR